MLSACTAATAAAQRERCKLKGKLGRIILGLDE
jgi:hypothetical protein